MSAVYVPLRQKQMEMNKLYALLLTSVLYRRMLARKTTPLKYKAQTNKGPNNNIYFKQTHNVAEAIRTKCYGILWYYFHL